MLPQPFSVDATGTPGGAPVITPWKRLVPDPRFAGSWALFGDLDGDGQAELVSARSWTNHDYPNDRHYVTTVVATDLDGKTLWHWGTPGAGAGDLHYDVPCQLYDGDGDGRLEVVFCTERELVTLDGATGREKSRYPLPPEASDCIVFANLSGGPRATDVLVKTRYTQLWAYSRDWKPLWTTRLPSGCRTAHQPLPIDMDADGRDEIMAGFCLLNPDGTVRWQLPVAELKLTAGHLDCCRLLRPAKDPREMRLALTACDADCLMVVDGNGKLCWQVTGQHFESIDIGRVRSDTTGPQILVDISRPGDRSPLWVLDEQGRQLGEIVAASSRHHDLIEWGQDGTSAILLASARGVFDGHGKRLATLAIDDGDQVRDVMAADVTGDGVPEIVLTTMTGNAVYLYRLPSGVTPKTRVGLGTPANFTLY